MSDGNGTPREEGLVRGANGDDPVRVGKNQALAFAALARAYLEGGRKPLKVKQCQNLVRPFSTQPDLMLHNLEQLELISGDAARGRNRERIVFVEKTVTAKDGDDDRQMWPEIAAAADPEPPPAAPSVDAPPRAKSPILTFDQTRAFLRERFADVEFTVTQVVEATGMSQGTTYDRVRPLVDSGEIVQVGGIKGHKNNPARYRLGPVAAPLPEHDDPPPQPAPAQPRTIKSKDDIAAELATKHERLTRLRDAQTRHRQADRKRSDATAEVERLRGLLAEQEGKIAEADAELAEIGTVADNIELGNLEADILRDTEILDHYDDLLSRLTRL